MKKILIIAVLALVAITVLDVDVYGQCAMCRASVENSISNGENTIGAGLNTGILYLGAMPYLLFAVIAWAWYRNSKKETGKKIRVAQIIKAKLR
ncbi:hypothetical protein R9C00_19010 [Flammeovirgaceae bacterium SG7u.111]|nr:hypothetical protein [Flammeovirgaceae bacterium SG7u.132]WPO33791.1 hypothetical protein R9C00_19010 [Flammeovirgaceae bacterium SG7u.111]